MEQSKNCTIVMMNDGSFHKAKRLKRAEIGMEVHFQPLHESKSVMKQTFLLHRTKIAAVSIALLLTLFPAYFWHEDNKAFAFVNVDINPSVELKVNDDMKVLSMNPLNKEAEEMVASMKAWEKKPVSEIALDMITFSKDKGYMNSEQEVLIGVSYINKNSLDFSEEIEAFLKKETDDLLLAAYDVPKGVQEKAEQGKISVNELISESIKDVDQTSLVDAEEEIGSIGDEDKAIIQSFYNENETSTDDGKMEDEIPEESFKSPLNNSEMTPQQKFERGNSSSGNNNLVPPGANGKPNKGKSDNQNKGKSDNQNKGQGNSSNNSSSNSEKSNDHSSQNSEKAKKAKEEKAKNRSNQNKNKDHPTNKHSHPSDQKQDKGNQGKGKPGKNNKHNNRDK